MTQTTKAKGPQARPNIILDARHIAALHTYIAFSAFGTALVVGCLLHYKKIVKNGVAGYPQEWFPSVSSTIGDWYPERNLFQILIAIASGPRIALVFLQYYLTRSATSSLPTIVFIFGLVRTLSCGGWVYITSSDDHDVHDVLMITYIVANLPWMIGAIVCTDATNVTARRKRIAVTSLFFGSIVPMIYFFLQHKVHRIPGAYTHYSFFEWGLIILDILYDSIAEDDFSAANLQLVLGSSVTITANGSIDATTASALPPKPKATIAPDIIASASGRKPETEKPAPALTNFQLWRSIRDGAAQYRPAASFTADVYLAYIFWSIFTSLVPTMFYFSVWELGIAGHELSLLSTLSPALLGIPSLRDWATTRGGRVTLNLVSFVGLAAYVLPGPLQRLLAVSFATAVLMVKQFAEWSTRDAAYQGFLAALGLMLSSLSKHANHGNNPVWPMVNERSGGYNKTGLVLALLSVLELSYRPESDSAEAGEEASPPPAPPSDNDRSWITSSVALGSLVFSLHSLLTDSSTLIAWSWTGYTDRAPNGPVPNLHGSLTLIAQSVGVLIALIMSSWSANGVDALANPLWFVYGAASTYAMYTYKNWLGYFGGLNVAVFLMSIIPLVLQQVSTTTQRGKAYFTACLVTIVLDLANVWTVAYAFVPGGVYLRERTDVVLCLQMAALSLAFRWPGLKHRTSAAAFPQKKVTSYCRTVLALVSVASVLVTLYRMPSAPPRPYRTGQRMIRSGVWTLHFGIDNEGRDSQRRVRDLIKDMELDVVGLLETDLHRIVFGNRDLTRVVSEELGYYVDCGPGPNQHTWGAVLLSKFPIINTTHHLLPSPDGELAPAIEAVLDVFGTEVAVIVAHNGQEETPLDRELQSKELARIMAKYTPSPTIFLGYVVTKPKAQRPNPYEILVSDGNVHDIDSFDWDRWCEYIFYRGLYRTSYARLSRGVVTDTELQIGQFVLPRHGSLVTNETDEARYLRSYKESLPLEHWFPMEYYGSEREGGKNGHYYHVFFTPLYYQIPENAVL